MVIKSPKELKNLEHIIIAGNLFIIDNLEHISGKNKVQFTARFTDDLSRSFSLCFRYSDTIITIDDV